MPALQDVSLTSKYDNSHHCLPEPLLALPKLRQLLVRFPSLTGIQNAVSKLTSLEVLRVEGLQQTLLIEPGVLMDPASFLCLSLVGFSVTYGAWLVAMTDLLLLLPALCRCWMLPCCAR